MEAIPPPEIPDYNLTRLLNDFVGFWQSSTFGLFEGLLAGLFILSVFLKTRSLSATAVAVVITSIVFFKSWMLIILALLLAGLLWGLWERSGNA